MSKDPLSRYLTKRELELAAEYEALGDDPERRDAIRRELYNLRWRLNEVCERKYHTTGKGRHGAAMNGEAAAHSIKNRFCNEEQFRKKLESAVKRLKSSPRLKHTVVTLLAVIAGSGRRIPAIHALMTARRCNYKAAEFKYDHDMKTLLAVFE